MLLSYLNSCNEILHVFNVCTEEKQDEHKSEDTDKAEKDTDKEFAKEDTSNFEKMDEYKTLANHVDIDTYDVKVAEDNSNKRVMLLGDDGGKPEYKTIYIKHKNMLKIVDLNGEIVYNGTI